MRPVTRARMTGMTCCLRVCVCKHRTVITSTTIIIIIIICGHFIRYLHTQSRNRSSLRVRRTKYNVRLASQSSRTCAHIAHTRYNNNNDNCTKKRTHTLTRIRPGRPIVSVCYNVLSIAPQHTTHSHVIISGPDECAPCAHR